MHLLLASTDEFMGGTYIAAPGKSSRVQQLMYGRKRATDGAERGASDTRVTQMKQMWCVSASYRCTPPPLTSLRLGCLAALYRDPRLCTYHFLSTYDVINGVPCATRASYV